MPIETGILCFSPTDTTRTICEAIAKGLGDNQPKLFNITLPGERVVFLSNPESSLAGIDHLIVGAPVYAGKLPSLVVETLNALEGNGIACTAVVVYGKSTSRNPAAEVGQFLRAQGLDKVYVLTEPFWAWRAASLPLRVPRRRAKP